MHVCRIRSALLSRATVWSLVGCCALWWLATATYAQAPVRRPASSAPANPLRSVTSPGSAVLLDSSVRPVQATEPELLPTPADALTAPGSEASVLAPAPIMHDLASQSWPGEAPAQQRYLPNRAHHATYHEPREPFFAHGDPNDPARHTGWGDPLTGTSWLNRPWYFGVFIGGMLADDLIADHVIQENAPLLGMRLGHDFDHFWGWEARYAFARTELFNGAGVPINEPGRNYFVDVALLHYPWGDSRWRPYLLAGLGFANYRFENDLGHDIDDSALTIPLGFGLKHYLSPWCTLRFDFLDTISFEAGQVEAMNHVSLSAGVEFRFGGSRPSYFPWSGNTSYW